jgi:glycosyltransferase involved in cell wall biosynthesis
MKLLFITRKYPPMVGGMEKLSFALAKEFTKNTDTTLITWGKSQKYLPYFLISAFFKALYFIPTKKINHIHLGDALLSPLGIILKYIFGIKTTVTVAGLDITFNFPGYQLLIPLCVAQLDKIVCISNATRDECIKRGIPKSKIIVIPCGVYPNDYIEKAHRSDLSNMLKFSTDKIKVLVTVGRLVERKGVYWFIKNVLPQINTNYIYLVIGDGQEKNRIEKLIKDKKLQNNVLILGKISHEKLKLIYNTADLFIMPNITVDHTMEGFGIVAIEASVTGLPVIAAKTEGIQDAVIDGKTGELIESMDAQGFAQEIKHTKHFDRKTVSVITQKNYSWESIGKLYMQQLQ